MSIFSRAFTPSKNPNKKWLSPFFIFVLYVFGPLLVVELRVRVGGVELLALGVPHTRVLAAREVPAVEGRDGGAAVLLAVVRPLDRLHHGLLLDLLLGLGLGLLGLRLGLGLGLLGLDLGLDRGLDLGLGLGLDLDLLDLALLGRRRLLP